MRATVMYGAGDVRIENVPDALVRVTRAAICGSDLWPYTSMKPNESGHRMGHEFIGIVEELLPDVLEGRIERGWIFDRVGGVENVPDDYRAMNEREAIKFMIEF
jgi:threonine dehydrogenase-like Zn-dependent dehydrogenase